MFTVENVCDVGEGMTLFEDFALEDWALLQLRMDLALTMLIWKKDVADSDRPGIPMGDFEFYFNKFFKKTIQAAAYGKQSFKEITEMVKDTVTIDEDKNVVLSALPEDAEPTIELLLKHTEHQREARQRRLDAGDDSATLKFTHAVLHGGNAKQQGNNWQKNQGGNSNANWQKNNQGGPVFGKGKGGKGAWGKAR